MPKVLISDKLSPAAVEIFKNRGLDVDFKPGLPKEELLEIIGQYDGLAIRSATKVTADVLEKADNLKVVGRAGIGVDNVDIPQATSKGVIVMNTPFGNSITTAEHAISMMMALARDIPQANASTHAGKWEKSKFMGVELTAKTLGVIGCGNIGSIVCDRALGLKMKVIGFDPFLTAERAADMGIEKVELDELLKRADVITLHTPMTDSTRGIINADAFAKMKDGVRIVNCARGGLIVEADLKVAIESGKVAGAALDVFEEEPAKENALFGMDKVVATPHLGASTSEAQENVALQVAEQMADYLLDGAITNAINVPSVSAEDAQKLGPWITLSEQLGLFAGQLTETGLEEITIEFVGDAADLNTKPLVNAMLMGLMKPMLTDVNMVSAPAIVKERGIAVNETKKSQHGAYEGYIMLSVKTERQTRSVGGTVFGDGTPRIIQVKGIGMEAALTPDMLYVTNDDKPGFIGGLGTVLGDAGINIASFNLGRVSEGSDAIALIDVDQEVGADVLDKVMALPNVKQAKALKF
ncbi:phosphoglycerate dehydrogenase [Pyruvatibacter sp. HU-CL02332]|uniref:phosphoglycerate dehydrogenase n=1 Tax=Pyruvatibacter sp. HU-CL02332 TaxID=3127650 RepID=UPI0031045EA9